jgi:serine/threonine protein kinase
MANGHIKICDLGLSIHVDASDYTKIRFVAGTAGYWAPEIVLRKCTHKTSDWWSFAGRCSLFS